MIQLRKTDSTAFNPPSKRKRLRSSQPLWPRRLVVPGWSLPRLRMPRAAEVWRAVQFYFRRPQYTGKVFCVGFNKTGTTSLGKALKELGYWHSTYTDKTWLDYYKNNKIVKLLEHTAKLDSVDDLPWLKEDMIPILDKVFPKSKFIYLERDEDSWQRSIYHWSYQLTGEYPDMDQKLAEFRAHREFVLDYFKERSSDEFIVLNIADPEGFAKLAKFLGKPTARKAFSHYNATFPKSSS